MSSHDPNATPEIAVPAQQDPMAAAKNAGNDAVNLVKALITDPFAAVQGAAGASAQTKLGVGAVFAAVYVLCSGLAFGGLFIFGGGLGGALAAALGGSVSLFIKSALIGVVGFAGLVGGIFAARAVFGGRGDPVTDLVVAGIAFLPYSVVLLATRFIPLGMGNLVLLAVALSFAIIILFDYLSSVSGVDKRKALLGVPLAIVAFGLAVQVASKIVF